MIRVFDFRCKYDHVTEHFLDHTPKDGDVQKCECGEWAVKVPATPRAQLDGCSGHFPGAADKWERNREGHMARERKNQENHGSYD
jgi:hypothetical protein